MNTMTIRWVNAAARVVAWLAGGDPRDVWPSYETFEEDSCTLFDTVEAFYGNVKWILEERERARTSTEEAASTHLRLDGGLPVQVDLDLVVESSRGRR